MLVPVEPVVPCRCFIGSARMGGGLKTKLKKLVRRIFGFEKIERGELSHDEYVYAAKREVDKFRRGKG